MSFLLTPRAKRWYVVGAYIPPKDVPNAHCMEQALKAAPKGLEMILMGNLNVRLRDPNDKHEEELATALADRGLFSITYHAMPQWRYMVSESWTWSMQR